MERSLEICCYSVESAIKAEYAGANRIELCDNHTEGGTTPSYATIKYVINNLRIPVNVILRPRGGDFLYSDIEFEVMKEDALKMKELGVNGIVFGILTTTGEIDIDRTREILELTHPLECTFHRAFDMCQDHFKSLEQLKKLGIKRILTSGGKNTIYDGIELLSKLVEAAKNEIIIMPGSGINENTIEKILQETGAKEFHSSAKIFVNSDMNYLNPTVKMGKNQSIDEYKKISVDTNQIKKMIKILNK